MPTAANALVQFEQGQSLVSFVALTDSGDHQTFTFPNAIVSNATGKAPVIRPNGITSGSNLVSVAASGDDDKVDVAAFTAWSQGTEHSVAAAADTTITRPATAVAKVNSITMTSAGAVAVVAGDDSLSTAFSETRGAAGGPPEIPADSVELAQVRVTSNSSAPITAAQIFQVDGQHAEYAISPSWQTNPIGEGRTAATSAKRTAHVSFASALPLSHASATARRVYAQYYTPIFGSESRASDHKAVETSHSSSSTQYYGGSIGSVSESLGQGGFTALVDDGVSEAIVGAKNDTRTVKFFPDRNKAPYVLTQGKIGISRSWPAGNQIQVAVTMTAEQASAEFTS